MCKPCWMWCHCYILSIYYLISVGNWNMDWWQIIFYHSIDFYSLWWSYFLEKLLCMVNCRNTGAIPWVCHVGILCSSVWFQFGRFPDLFPQFPPAWSSAPLPSPVFSYPQLLSFITLPTIFKLPVFFTRCHILVVVTHGFPFQFLFLHLCNVTDWFCYILVSSLFFKV